MRVTEHSERRKRFRRQSDRNFGVSIIMMFILTFILGLGAGWYMGVAASDDVQKRALTETVR